MGSRHTATSIAGAFIPNPGDMGGGTGTDFGGTGLTTDFNSMDWNHMSNYVSNSPSPLEVNLWKSQIQYQQQQLSSDVTPVAQGDVLPSLRENQQRTASQMSDQLAQMQRNGATQVANVRSQAFPVEQLTQQQYCC